MSFSKWFIVSGVFFSLFVFLILYTVDLRNNQRANYAADATRESAYAAIEVASDTRHAAYIAAGFIDSPGVGGPEGDPTVSALSTAVAQREENAEATVSALSTAAAQGEENAEATMQAMQAEAVATEQTQRATIQALETEARVKDVELSAAIAAGEEAGKDAAEWRELVESQSKSAPAISAATWISLFSVITTFGFGLLSHRREQEKWELSKSADS